MAEQITALVRTVWKEVAHRGGLISDAARRGGYGLLTWMKERILALVRTMWKEIIHRDDATDEEKRLLVEETRNAPPISLPCSHSFIQSSL